METTSISTLAELSYLLGTYKSTCFDRLVSPRALFAESYDKIAYNGVTYSLTTTAQAHLCSKLGIPVAYMRKCSSINKLDARNIQAHLDNLPDDTKFFIRFDGSNIRAVFTPKYKVTDNYDIVQALMSYFPSDKEVEYTLTDELFVVRVLFDKTTEVLDIKDLADRDMKDRYRVGISIVNSETGHSRFETSSYLLRLLCTNGLIGRVKSKYASFRHIKQSHVSLPSIIAETLAYSQDDLVLLKQAHAMKLEDPKATLEKTCKALKLNKVEYQAALWGFGEESGNTMYHIIQALTKGAQADDLSETSRYTLQCAGGLALGLVTNCANTLA